MLKSYKELIVWQKSFKLAVEVYKLTSGFPKSDLYGLTIQMQRSAFSIPSNIAEGYARGHRREYIQFLSIVYGSGAELETQLLLAKEVGLVSESKYRGIGSLLNEVMSMLNSLIRKLREIRAKPSTPNPKP